MTMIGIDDLRARIGERLGTSPWLLVDQPMINAFADATGDHQFIHVDPDRAATTPFGGTIAHGFLTLSLLSQMIEATDMPRVDGIVMGVNYGADKLRFIAPVRAGKRIRTHFTLLAIDEKRPGQYQQKIDATVEIEGEDKPALIAEWLTMFFTKA